MKYDVFLVNALADNDQAEMLVRRLKALKFKVRHDKGRTHTTPTPRDYRDADASQSIIVLWSKDACDTSRKDSDWLHAIAHHARSKDGVLVQVGLDDTVPDDPFSHDPRYMLAGLTARKTVEPYYALVDDLGKRDGRKDLRSWIDLGASDKAGQAAWKKKYPTDPLSLVGLPVPKKAEAPKAATVTKLAGAGLAGAALAGSLAGSRAGSTTSAPIMAAAAAPVSGSASVASLATYEEEESGFGWWIIGSILAGIGLMLLLGWLLRSKPGLPAVANATNMVAVCPAGQMPAYLLDDSLRTGPITDDTSN